MRTRDAVYALDADLTKTTEEVLRNIDWLLECCHG